MGRVFLGVSARGRPVAVKVIRADLAADPEFRMRFGREVASARRVSGVFTAPVVDADVDGTPPWLATAYVPGPSLSEAVASHGPLPTGSLLTLTAGLAESLSAIHAAGVVHRDLKPSNVLIAEDGPRVIDFGISRAAESTALTQAGLVIGSPGFMSPEQAAGYEVGMPTDIFSLGAVLAFAATGEGPFGAGTTAALLYRVVHGTPGLDRVPAEVRPLIERCLAKDPGQRPTASSLLADVGALQPTASWLPESIIRAFTQDAAPGPAPATTGVPFGSGPALVGGAALVGEAATQTHSANSAAQVPSGAGLPVALTGISQAATSGSVPVPPGGTYPPGDAYSPPPRGGANRPRRRWLRPLALAWVLGFLVAAGVAVLAMTVFTGHTPTPGQSPAAQISSPTGSTSAGRTPSAASTSRGASSSSNRGASSSSSASSQPAGAPASPSVYSSQLPTASASPRSSPSASRTPTPTPSTSSPSPTPSASASTTPAPTPSSSTSSPASAPTSAPPSASASAST